MNILKACAIATLFPMAAAAAVTQSSASSDAAYTDSAVFAGGCFWCVESDFEKLDGVGDVVSGYTGGALQNPTYKNHDGHIEATRIPFDPTIISFRELADYFFRHVDPLDAGGQFCDRGHAYTTAIFYQSDQQQSDAQAAKANAENTLGETVVTPIRKLEQFWIAEGYHQDFYKKNPLRYKYYRTSCRRDRRVKAVWGKHKK
jgi:peptide-methionine (S)-S-oxide reductase